MWGLSETRERQGTLEEWTKGVHAGSNGRFQQRAKQKVRQVVKSLTHALENGGGRVACHRTGDAELTGGEGT